MRESWGKLVSTSVASRCKRASKHKGTQVSAHMMHGMSEKSRVVQGAANRNASMGMENEKQ